MLKFIDYIDNKLLYLLAWCLFLSIAVDMLLYGPPAISINVWLVGWMSRMMGGAFGNLIISLFIVFVYKVTIGGKFNFEAGAVVATFMAYLNYFEQTQQVEYYNRKNDNVWEMLALIIGVVVIFVAVLFITDRIYQRIYIPNKDNWKNLFKGATPLARTVIVLPFFWSICVGLYVLLFGEKFRYMNDDDIAQIFSVMFFPSIILVCGYFLYTKIINPTKKGPEGP